MELIIIVVGLGIILYALRGIALGTLKFMSKSLDETKKNRLDAFSESVHKDNPKLEKDLQRLGNSFQDLGIKLDVRGGDMACPKCNKVEVGHDVDDCNALSELEKKRKTDKILSSKTSLVGKNKKMVVESIGNPKFKDENNWYYGESHFEKKITFEKHKDGHKVVSIENTDGLWLDMPLKMLIASYGKPEDEKKNVTKNGTKSKLYFGSRTTRQKTTVYKLEVRVENDKVVGWKDLE